MRGSTSVGYDQFETSPEAIEQELRPAVYERRLTDRLKTNYSIDNKLCVFITGPSTKTLLQFLVDSYCSGLKNTNYIIM